MQINIYEARFSPLTAPYAFARPRYDYYYYYLLFQKLLPPKMNQFYEAFNGHLGGIGRSFRGAGEITRFFTTQNLKFAAGANFLGLK